MGSLESLDEILELAKKLPVGENYFSILQYSYELGKRPRDPQLLEKQDIMFSKLLTMNLSRVKSLNDKCIFWLLVQKAFEVGAVERAKEKRKVYPYLEYFDNVRFYRKVEKECYRLQEWELKG